MARLEVVPGAKPAADEAPDERALALVERAKDGDIEAWSRIYQEHFDPVFRHLRYLSGDAEVTEELVQETFVQALTAIASFKEESTFSTWLHGIGLNVVRAHWRRNKNRGVAHERLQTINEVVQEAGERPDRAVLRRQRTAALYAALEQLPDHLREAFILRDLVRPRLPQARRWSWEFSPLRSESLVSPPHRPFAAWEAEDACRCASRMESCSASARTA
jgi:RNA polymerase sigma-70 factor (ECF subfamily)